MDGWMDYGWMRYDTIAYKVYNVLYVSKLGNGYGKLQYSHSKTKLKF